MKIFDSYLFIIILGLISIGLPLAAQNQENWVPIALTLYNGSMGDLDDRQTEIAGRKVTLILDRYGYVASTDKHSFGVFPKFIVEESVPMEGLQNMVAVKGEFSLVAKQVDNGLVVGSCAVTITGSGANATQALNNAIQNLSTNSNVYANFFKTVQQKINAYYDKNCASIMAEAQTALNSKQALKAVMSLGSIPREAGCFTQIQPMLTKAFLSHQNEQCGKLMQAAKGAVAGMNYEYALKILAMIDPQSACAKESNALIQSTATKVSVQDRRNWDFLLQAYQSEVELEKLRINAVKEVYKAYAEREENWYYTLIVR
jgi:hypothetical protein